MKIIFSLFNFLFFFFLLSDLRSEDSSGSSSYRERFKKVSPPERDVPIEEGKGKGDGWGGGPKRGKAGKGKKKRDDFRRVTGTDSNDPIVPVTGVKTGDLIAVTYKSPSPPAPVLDMAWNSTAWAPTYQASIRELNEEWSLETTVQAELISKAGWFGEGGICTPPDLMGTYDSQTGNRVEAPKLSSSEPVSRSLLGTLGNIGAKGLKLALWDNPISPVGPLSRANPFGGMRAARHLVNSFGVLVKFQNPIFAGFEWNEDWQFERNYGLPGVGETLWATFNLATVAFPVSRGVAAGWQGASSSWRALRQIPWRSGWQTVGQFGRGVRGVLGDFAIAYTRRTHATGSSLYALHAAAEAAWGLYRRRLTKEARELAKDFEGQLEAYRLTRETIHGLIKEFNPNDILVIRRIGDHLHLYAIARREAGDYVEIVVDKFGRQIRSSTGTFGKVKDFIRTLVPSEHYRLGRLTQEALHELRDLHSLRNIFQIFMIGRNTRFGRDRGIYPVQLVLSNLDFTLLVRPLPPVRLRGTWLHPDNIRPWRRRLRRMLEELELF